jgi:hypothetical protein
MVFFDSNEIADEDEFDALPAGSYPLMVCKAEMRPTKSGTGRYCNVEFAIANGSGSGRKVFDIFNLENQSEVAQRIGKSHFKSFVVAAGVPIIKDEDHLFDLVDKIVVADLVVERGTDGKDRNKVKKYYSSVKGNSEEDPIIKKDGVLDRVPF